MGSREGIMNVLTSERGEVCMHKEPHCRYLSLLVKHLSVGEYLRKISLFFLVIEIKQTYCRKHAKYEKYLKNEKYP